jgi:hypothetical protein
MGQYET